MEVSNKDKGFNPLIVNLQTLEVGYNKGKPKLKATWESYYHQIKNNLYVSVKAEYLVARDLYDAEETLTVSEFKLLTERLGFAESTITKYLNVGKDTRLWRLFGKGKLPLKWTTNYLLTTLTDAQFEKVEERIDPDMTALQIKQIANIDRKTDNEFKKMLLSFLQVEVENTIDVVGFETLVKSVKKALKSIPEINVNDDKVDTVIEKLKTVATKQSKKSEDIMRAKKILSDYKTSYDHAQAVA